MKHILLLNIITIGLDTNYNNLQGSSLNFTGKCFLITSAQFFFDRKGITIEKISVTYKTENLTSEHNP
jgi:hypothetical protein